MNWELEGDELLYGRGKTDGASLQSSVTVVALFNLLVLKDGLKGRPWSAFSANLVDYRPKYGQRIPAHCLWSP